MGESVAVRATIEAKGYDWRLFSQRIVEVFDFVDGGVSQRRMYAMLADVALDKAATVAMNNALEFRGGSTSVTLGILDGFFSALLASDRETALGFLADKATLVDSVYGVVSGPENVLDAIAGTPRPAFGSSRVTRSFAGVKDGMVETAIDPSRPRRADWVRIVDGKIMVIEAYWMLREIGVQPESYQARYPKQVILPI